MFATYRPVSVIVNYERHSAFIKVQTRRDAEEAKQHLPRSVHVAGQPLRLNWACGFGPKPIMDRRDGTSRIPLVKLTESDVTCVVKELGTAFIQRHRQQCESSLTDASVVELNSTFGVYLGALTMEEPEEWRV